MSSSCRSTDNAALALQQKIRVFDDSAERGNNYKRQKGEPGAVALEKNVSKRCHLDDEDSSSGQGGSRKNMSNEGTQLLINNFLHEVDDFTFIDADEDLQPSGSNACGLSSDSAPADPVQQQQCGLSSSSTTVLRESSDDQRVPQLNGKGTSI